MARSEKPKSRVADHAQPLDDGRVVLTVPRRRPSRFRQEADLFVVADGAARHLRGRGDLPDRQRLHAADRNVPLTFQSTGRFSIDGMNRLAYALALVTLAALLPSARASAQQHPEMPPGMTHDEHLAQMKRDAEMKARGAQAMGFDQDAVAHHFLLAADGGVIQVDVLDPNDEASVRAIRGHLRQIAAAFQAGSFDAPLATHAEVPDGVPVLRRLRSAVSYAFDETPTGGRVRIVTADAEALAAVHAFLRYQIREHHTGDPLM